MQHHLFDPGPMDLSSERARAAFDDEWFGKDVLLWTEDGIAYKTAPYRGVWQGFGPGFLGLTGHLWQGGGSTMNTDPRCIVHIQAHNPLLAVERQLERFLQEVV